MRKSERNRGAAMVIVLCVMMVFLALSVTVVLAGSVTLNTARNNIIFERGKIQAASLSDLIVADMARELIKGDSSLPQYVRNQIMETGWMPYDEEADNREEAVRVFNMDDDIGEEEEKLHQIRIEMYWMGDGVPDEDVPDAIGSEKNVHLFIDVVSTLNGMEYRVSSEFELSGLTKNTTGKMETEYPCIWTWSVVGRQ